MLRNTNIWSFGVLGALAAATPAASSPPAAPHDTPVVCPPTTAFTSDLEYLDGYRVFTGPDGDSAVEPLRIPARFVPLLNTGARLGIVDLPRGGDRAVQIVVGGPNIDLALHPAPYREMFVLLGGSITFRTAKMSVDMQPGSVLLFEDVDATIGHGGRTGPCGYVSLSIKPADQ